MEKPSIAPLVDFLNRYSPLSSVEETFLWENAPVKSIVKNEYLLKEGEVCREIYFLMKGAVRMYQQAESGEKTTHFYLENSFISSYTSYSRRLPSTHNLETIEPCEVVVFNADFAKKTLDKFPNFSVLSRAVMREELCVLQEIIGSFIGHTPADRYAKLVKENSPLLQRIPQYQLAAYLGVSPESLSRIRRRQMDL